MPNPVRPLRKTDRLTMRQKNIVRKNKAMGLSSVVYRRKGNHNKLSVHSPLLDVQRKAKVGSVFKTKKYPHARDSPVQVNMRLLKGRAYKGSRKVSKTTARKFLFP